MNTTLQTQTSLLGSHDGDRPLSQDPDYPPLLRELAEVVQGELSRIGIDLSYASAVAETVSEHVRERFGGQPNYWPKGNTMRQRRRRMRMWEDFNGHNHLELAVKYGVCLQQVYRMLAIAKAEMTNRVQPGLFDTPAGAQ